MSHYRRSILTRPTCYFIFDFRSWSQISVNGVRLAYVHLSVLYLGIIARPPRIEFPGAFYHVIVRGNLKQDIFIDEQDRLEYLERIKRYKEKCGFIFYVSRQNDNVL